MLDKKVTHSIYLIKKDFVERNEYLQNIEHCTHYTVPISGNESANVYLKTVPSKIHSWSRLLPTELSGINWNNIRTSSFYGLLLIQVNDRVFALTSGSGRYLLHPFSIENRFGFKTVLNSVDPQTIQQLSKTTLAQNPKTSIEQVTKGVNLGQFGIDGFTDLISKVKGKSKIENLGLTLDGEDALKISVKHELDQLPELLKECQTYYDSNEYKTYFPEIDNLAQVKDKEQKSVLNTDLESSLNDELELAVAGAELSGDVWASIPEIVFDDNFECYTYKESENALRYHDIELKNIFAECYLKRDKTKKRNVSIATLTHDKIYIRKADGTTYPKWRALNCINAIIERNDEQYFFLEGKWFRASLTYVESLDRKIIGIPSANLSFNNWPQPVLEKDYLETRPLVYHQNYIVSDRNNIRIKGQSAVEPCDIFTENKLMIHLKRYGSSALLGHLFNQGYVSGDLLLNSVEYKEKFNEKLEDEFKIYDINPSDFTVAYVIGSKYEGNQKLPLFSKIILTKAYDELRKKGFKVTLDFCGMSPY